MDKEDVRVVSLMQRMWSKAVKGFVWKWDQLSHNSDFNEYNALARIGKQRYLVIVENVEDWPDGES